MNTVTSHPPSRWVRIKGVCPACQHKGDCTRTEDGAVIKCMRTPSTRPCPQKDGRTGYIHRADQLGVQLPRAVAAAEPPKRSTAEWKIICKQHQTSVNPKRLERLAATLGLSVRSLKRFGIGIDTGGYDGRTGTGWWTFPMVDGEGKIIGLRRRSDDGSHKDCVPGSRNGLFVPENLDLSSLPDGIVSDGSPLLLLLPEGPTSAAAADDLGFRAIGRPNNSGGALMIREFLSQGAPQDVVIVADDEGTKWRRGDPRGPFPDKLTVPSWPGWEGALHTAMELHDGNVSRLRVAKVKDADGNKVKDLRKFLQGGGHANVVNHVLAAAQDCDARWIRDRLEEVQEWSRRLHMTKLAELERERGRAT